MIYLIEDLFMQLLMWVLGIIDSVFAIFGAVSGLTPVSTSDGTQVTLSQYFLQLDGVQKTFVIMLLAAIAVCAVCTVVAIVKGIVNMKGEPPKPISKIVGQSLGSVIITLVMALVLTVGITASDGLLRAINTSMNGDSEMIVSQQVLNLSIQQTYKLDTDNIQGLNEFDEDGNVTSVKYLYKFKEDPNAPGQPAKYTENGGIYTIFLKEDGSAYYFEDIYEKDTTKKTVTNEDGTTTTVDRYPNKYVIKDYSMLTLQNAPDSGYADNKTIDDLPTNMWMAKTGDVLGTTKGGFIFPSARNEDGAVLPGGFNFLVAYVTAVILLIALLSATLGLVKRLYDIVMLFIALPAVCATIPLDDGAKFKLWRETLVSKVMLAYGSVLAVNLFFIIAPSLWSVSLGGDAFINTVLRMLLICGGALTINGAQMLFARLLGTSAEESREMGQAARTLFGAGMAVKHGAQAVGRGILGTKNANGQRVGGLLRGGAGAAEKALGGVGAIGTAIGGQNYKNSKGGRALDKVRDGLRGYANKGKDNGGGGRASAGGGGGGGGDGGGEAFTGGNNNHAQTAAQTAAGAGGGAGASGDAGAGGGAGASGDAGASGGADDNYKPEALPGGRFENGILDAFGQDAKNRALDRRATKQRNKAKALGQKGDNLITASKNEKISQKTADRLEKKGTALQTKSSAQAAKAKKTEGDIKKRILSDSDKK